jgi:hypothetical protein
LNKKWRGCNGMRVVDLSRVCQENTTFTCLLVGGNYKVTVMGKGVGRGDMRDGG